jgi:hypothetical protein
MSGRGAAVAAEAHLRATRSTGCKSKNTITRRIIGVQSETSPCCNDDRDCCARASARTRWEVGRTSATDPTAAKRRNGHTMNKLVEPVPQRSVPIMSAISTGYPIASHLQSVSAISLRPQQTFQTALIAEISLERHRRTHGGAPLTLRIANASRNYPLMHVDDYALRSPINLMALRSEQVLVHLGHRRLGALLLNDHHGQDISDSQWREVGWDAGSGENIVHLPVSRRSSTAAGSRA